MARHSIAARGALALLAVMASLPRPGLAQESGGNPAPAAVVDPTPLAAVTGATLAAESPAPVTLPVRASGGTPVPAGGDPRNAGFVRLASGQRVTCSVEGPVKLRISLWLEPASGEPESAFHHLLVLEEGEETALLSFEADLDSARREEWLEVPPDWHTYEFLLPGGAENVLRLRLDRTLRPGETPPAQSVPEVPEVPKETEAERAPEVERPRPRGDRWTFRTSAGIQFTYDSNVWGLSSIERDEFRRPESTPSPQRTRERYESYESLDDVIVTPSFGFEAIREDLVSWGRSTFGVRLEEQIYLRNDGKRFASVLVTGKQNIGADWLARLQVRYRSPRLIRRLGDVDRVVQEDVNGDQVLDSVGAVRDAIADDFKVQFRLWRRLSERWSGWADYRFTQTDYEGRFDERDTGEHEAGLGSRFEVVPEVRVTIAGAMQWSHARAHDDGNEFSIPPAPAFFDRFVHTDKSYRALVLSLGGEWSITRDLEFFAGTSYTEREYLARSLVRSNGSLADSNDGRSDWGSRVAGGVRWDIDGRWSVMLETAHERSKVDLGREVLRFDTTGRAAERLEVEDTRASFGVEMKF